MVSEVPPAVLGPQAAGGRAGHRPARLRAEPAFDELALLAATMTRTKRAFVTLVDDRRSFWKAPSGWASCRSGRG